MPEPDPAVLPTLQTPRLRLVLESTEAVLARIDALPPEHRAEVSPDWLARLRDSTPSPWTHAFAVVESASGSAVGSCAFKGGIDAAGTAEIAYQIGAGFQGRGYAKEAAAALAAYAFEAGAKQVVGHTLPAPGPSTSVLTACGFRHAGEFVDPEDGPVWRWVLAPA